MTFIERINYYASLPPVSELDAVIRATVAPPRSEAVAAPATSAAGGAAGQVAADGNFIYAHNGDAWLRAGASKVWG